ncbi:MAG: BlaI/MecI/CopY family transcriptional regulator [Clostridia bacterium]|nr:BlaI/MecI/CopY family transcriptional regulator [Clostridia bacterium]
MKKKIVSLPDAELDVMKVIWRRGEPSLVSDIHADLQETRKCTKPAVHILLDRLAKKEFVRIDVVDKPIQYKLITPLVSEEEYCSAASEGFINKLFNGNWRRLVANLVDSGEISSANIDEIAAIINSKADEKGDDIK